MFYKAIKEVFTAELIIKKSRFISILIPLNQLQDVEKELHGAKQKYLSANHYCFAYTIHYGSFEKQFSSIMKQLADIQYTEQVRVELWIAVDKLPDFMAKVVNLSLGTATMELGEDGFVPQC